MNQSTIPRKSHYIESYDTLERFISYYHQTSKVIELDPNSILEIGCGNKTFYNYIKSRGLNITSLDIQKDLNPDIVGDVKNLPFKNFQFDVVTAFQVLEHLPFSEFDMAIKEMSRVAKKSIISIPYSSMNIDIVSGLNFGFFKRNLRFKIGIPFFFKGIAIGGENTEHYWEMGRKGYPKNRIKKHLQTYFTIEREFTPTLNSYHYFFILKSRAR